MANEIFISYRRTDEPKARLLYNLLKERGVEAWYDAKIAAGEDWRYTTANALDAAPIFVLLMSKTASESGDIAKELAAATHKRKLVVPVRLDDMQLEGVFLYELASRNWTDAFQNTEKQLADLADKLAALVKADLSPESAAALEVNVAEAAAAKGAAEKAKGFAFTQKSGSVAVITAAAAALVVAAGSGVWLLKGSSGTNAEAASSAAVEAFSPTAEAATATANAAPAPQPVADLSASLNDLAEAAKAAGRSDAEIAALTDASGKLAAMPDGAPSTEMDTIALEAARKQIATLANDSTVSAVKSDFKIASAEQKASGMKMDPSLAQAIDEANTAQAAIKAATETAAGTDAAAAVEAVKAAQQAVNTLTALRPVANDAFIKAKRQSYASNSAAARSIAGQIAQLASTKKPNVFASSERKDAFKYVAETDVWARSRMAEIDVLASSVATADRKTITKYASQAATVKAELEKGLVNARTEAAKLAK